MTSAGVVPGTVSRRFVEEALVWSSLTSGGDYSKVAGVCQQALNAAQIPI
jgi:hypothetical protein